jgi:hypothetical protein
LSRGPAEFATLLDPAQHVVKAIVECCSADCAHLGAAAGTSDR